MFTVIGIYGANASGKTVPGPSAFASAPASAISYPLRIVGDTGSVAVELVDTPDFFVPQELRALSSGGARPVGLIERRTRAVAAGR